MLRYYSKAAHSSQLQQVASPQADHMWLYASEVTSDELAQLADRYQLDTGILRDVRDRHELPRTEYAHTSLYTFLRAPYQTSKGTLGTVPVLAILQGSNLLTLSSFKYLSPEEFLEDTVIDARSMKHVLLQFANCVVLKYESYLHQTATYITNTEKRLEKHKVDNNDFIKFVDVEHDLNEYSTNLMATKSALARMRENKHDTFGDKDCEYIEDIILHIEQLLVSVESRMRQITSIRNAYTTISNNTLNQRMKTLTLLTLLVALPNVFYGMFGMNVRLPFADQEWAYAAITGFTLLMVTVAFIVVRRLRF